MKIIYFTSFWIHYVILGDQYCSRSSPLVFPRPLSGVYLRWRQSVSSPGSPSFPFWCHLRILCLFCIFRFSPAVVLFPFPRPRCRSRRYIFRYFPALLFHFPHILWNCLFFSLCCGAGVVGWYAEWARKMCLCCPTAIYPLDSIVLSTFPRTQRLCGVHNGCLLVSLPALLHILWSSPSSFLTIFIHFEVCRCHSSFLLANFICLVRHKDVDWSRAGELIWFLVMIWGSRRTKKRWSGHWVVINSQTE